MQRKIHIFDNGVRVYDDHLMQKQRERYKYRNVHEAEEEDIFVNLIKKIPNDGCFVNIGSAIGYYLILAKKISPHLQVHAVEPLEKHIKCFRENLALNDLNEDEFELHKEAVSSTNGMVKFIDLGYGSSVYIEKKNLKSRIKGIIKKIINNEDKNEKSENNINLYTVKTISLNRLVRNIGSKVDLLQMDVQGHEVSILKAASSTLRKNLVNNFIIGTHSKFLHEECIAIFKYHNYVIDFENQDTQHQPDGIIVAHAGNCI